MSAPAPRRAWLTRLLSVLPDAVPRQRTGPVHDDETGANLLDVPTEVTRDRLASYLGSRGYTFRLDEDGDITGTWDGNRFWFMLLGVDKDIIQVRGRWHRPLAESNRIATLQIVNDWNRDRIWPKAYVRRENGALSLYTEHSVDFGPGATQDQIDETLAGGLGNALQLFASVAASLRPQVHEDDGDMDDNDGPVDDD